MEPKEVDSIIVEAALLIRDKDEYRHGVVISTDDPVALRVRLYARMDVLAADPKYQELQVRMTIRIPPRPLELWLMPLDPTKRARKYV